MFSRNYYIGPNTNYQNSNDVLILSTC
jgi:hypothetical protein